MIKADKHFEKWKMECFLLQAFLDHIKWAFYNIFTKSSRHIAAVQPQIARILMSVMKQNASKLGPTKKLRHIISNLMIKYFSDIFANYNTSFI